MHEPPASTPARDRITVTGITATGYHGVFDHERRDGQTFVADVTLHVDTRAAAAEDRLDLTVDYGVLSEQVAGVLSGEPADLVETVAERIAAVALGHAGVHAVDVVVHKPQAPVTVPFGDVTVAIHRDREHVPSVAGLPVAGVPALVPDEVPAPEAGAYAERWAEPVTPELPFVPPVPDPPVEPARAREPREPLAPEPTEATALFVPDWASVAGAEGGLGATAGAAAAGAGLAAAAHAAPPAPPAPPAPTPAAWSPVGPPDDAAAQPTGEHTAVLPPEALHAALAEPTAPMVPGGPPVDRLDATPTEPVEAVLALGSNLGASHDTLRQAVRDLAATPGVEVTAIAPLARTQAVGGPEQPDYLNTVVLVRTTLSPRGLLAACHAVEQAHGRVRTEHWGPRTVDVDIVVYGSLVAAADDLELPHPRAHERAFVLEPWAQVQPDAVLPGLGGGPVAALAGTAPDRGGIRWMALDWWADPE